jgi:hypothetical protein
MATKTKRRVPRTRPPRGGCDPWRKARAAPAWQCALVIGAALAVGFGDGRRLPLADEQEMNAPRHNHRPSTTARFSNRGQGAQHHASPGAACRIGRMIRNSPAALRCMRLLGDALYHLYSAAVLPSAITTLPC